MLPEFSASAARMRSGVSSLVTIHMYRTCDTPVKGQSGRYPQSGATPVSFSAVTENADRAEMQRLLAFANYSKVAEAIGVKRAAVANWAAGRHVTPGRLEQVRALYGTTKEAPRPDWAEGLEDRIADRLEARLSLEVPERVVERVAARLGLPQQRSVEDPPEHIEAPRDSAGTARPPSK
jgi:transcriptional regulator with XRE-family HTH domain